MSLKAKASRVLLDDLDETPSPTSSNAVKDANPKDANETATDRSSFRSARSGVAAISQTINMQHRVQDLEQKVIEYEQAGVTVKLDPWKVRDSKWKNRHEHSFLSKRFSELKAEIEEAGGNVQPIKVRRLPQATTDGFECEVIYGRRRLRACRELGILVSALIQELNDIESFQAMERENRNREDLTAWEQGVMYKDALDQQLFMSQRQMCAALGLDSANLSRAIRLASLPQEVIQAFDTPLNLQFRWGADLADVVEKAPEAVFAVAKRLGSTVPRLPAKEVYTELMAVLHPKTVEKVKKEFKIKGKSVATWVTDERGNTTLKIKAAGLGGGRDKQLVDFLEKLIAG